MMSLMFTTFKMRGIQLATHESKRIALENVNHPGDIREVDAEMYHAMKRAFLKILPKTSPGLTPAEIQQRLLAHLPADLFPGGAKAVDEGSAIGPRSKRSHYASEDQATAATQGMTSLNFAISTEGGRSTESVEI